MKRLNQVLATEQAVRKRCEDEFTRVYQGVQKTELVNGFARNYQPKDEDGEKLPAENKKVVMKASDAIRGAKKALTELLDVTATKDNTNCNARADVVVDGQVLLTGVPATHLLFLEKRMVSLIDFIKRLPVLPQDENWRLNEVQGLFETEPVETLKTKKVERHEVVVPPTKEFPAQVAKVTQDVVAGVWKTVKFSGALPPDEVTKLLERAEKLQKALKAARQEANEAPVAALSTSPILNFIFG